MSETEHLREKGRERGKGWRGKGSCEGMKDEEGWAGASEGEGSTLERKREIRGGERRGSGDGCGRERRYYLLYIYK